MKKFILLASLAASGMFAACQHEAPTSPQPAPRELPPMGPKPTPIEPTPVPTQLPTAPHTHEGGDTHAIVPTDAGTPQPGAEQPASSGTVTPGPSATGPSALLETPDSTRRQLHSDDDLILSPSDRAERMPAPSTGAAQPMPADPGSDGSETPSSVKPDGGILYDAGAPLPPVPDAGPLPSPSDAGKPM